jgi:hypothetical protein
MSSLSSFTKLGLLIDLSIYSSSISNARFINRQPSTPRSPGVYLPRLVDLRSSAIVASSTQSGSRSINRVSRFRRITSASICQRFRFTHLIRSRARRASGQPSLQSVDPATLLNLFDMRTFKVIILLLQFMGFSSLLLPISLFTIVVNR